jgi:hypothetical protein
MSNRSVRADVEVRQRRAPHTSSTAVQQETFSGEETSLPGERFAPIQSAGQAASSASIVV